MLARDGDRAAAAHLLVEARRRGCREGILLGLLGASEASEASWDELCALFDGWSHAAPGLEALIDWACERLDAWPHDLCVAPLRWIWSAEGGYRHPRLRLAHTLDLRGLPNRHGDPEAARARTAAALQVIARSPDVTRIRRLILPDRGLDEVILEETLTQRAWPHLQHLDLRGNGIDAFGAALLARSERFPALRELLLERNDIASEGAKALARSPALSELRLLGLSFNPIGDAGLRDLTRSPHLSLRALRLGCCDLTESGLDGIGAGQATRGLRALILNYNLIGDDALFHLRELAELSRLELAYNTLSSESLAALARCTFRPRLQRLALSGNHLGDSGVSRLAHAGALPRLRALLLNQCEIHGAGLRELAESSALRDAHLEILELNGNAIHADALQALLHSPACRGLQRLEIRRNGLPPEAARLDLSELRHLQLGYNPIGDDGLLALARAPGLARLEHLGLEHTGASDRGLIALLDALHDRERCNLRVLSLRGNSIGDAGVDALARSPLLGQLELLDLFANGFSDRARTQLADAFRGAQREGPRRDGRLYC